MLLRALRVLPCLLAIVAGLSPIDRAVADDLSKSAESPESQLTFERHIRPILKTHCFQCHGEQDRREGNLDLRLRRLMLTGGDSGAAIQPSDPDQSLMLRRIRTGEMPPNGKTLPAGDVVLIERWLRAGALTAREEPSDPQGLSEISEQERAFWAFQPVVRGAVPGKPAGHEVSGEFCQSPVDAFIREQLDERGLHPSPLAPPATFIRRVTFDLIGLPPTPEEVDEFLADDHPDARERLFDRLLASPQYGERWGRQWLDVAGYADSDGYTEDDPVRKYSYKYRDWVIRALNGDMPFDQFVVEQLAGDELVTPPYANLSPDQQEHLIATGFLRTVADGTAQGADPKVARNAVIADTIKVVSTSLLGMTVGCAECHNHRYDPIPTRDYYRLRAVFEPALDWKNWRTPNQRLITLYTDADRAAAAAVEAEAQTILNEREEKLKAAIEVIFEKELAKVPEEHRERVKTARNTKDAERTPEQIALLKEYPSADPRPGQIDLYDPPKAAELQKDVDRANEVRKKKPVEDFLSPLSEVPGQIPTTQVFYRGDPDQPKDTVQPGELSVLDWLPPLEQAGSLPTSGRRLAYARHLVSGRHPLVSRVFVNRIWLGHFGKGLVATPGDFGVLGERPTHPRLLDWLAAEFVEPASPADTSIPNPHRWSIKRLHRLLLGSHVYQQSSSRTADSDALDPDNRWLARMSVRRLEAEAVRDAILSINGTLNRKLAGAPVPVMLDEDGQVVVGIENLNGENRPGPIIPLHGEEFRRSVYVQVRRSRPLAVLDAFDLPTLDPNCTSRNSSTVAPQSLMLMNSDFVLTMARHLGERLSEEASGNAVQCVKLAWRLIYSRDPSETELSAALRFVEEEQARLTAVGDAINDPKQKPDPVTWSWATFCQALFGSNEFLYVD